MFARLGNLKSLYWKFIVQINNSTIVYDNFCSWPSFKHFSCNSIKNPVKQWACRAKTSMVSSSFCCLYSTSYAWLLNVPSLKKKTGYNEEIYIKCTPVGVSVQLSQSQYYRLVLFSMAWKTKTAVNLHIKFRTSFFSSFSKREFLIAWYVNAQWNEKYISSWTELEVEMETLRLSGVLLFQVFRLWFSILNLEIIFQFSWVFDRVNNCWANKI